MNKPSLLFDFSHTIIYSLIIFILSIYSTHVFAIKLDPEQFGQLQLARRIVVYIFPIFIFGLNTALVRQVSFYQKPGEKKALLTAALLITIAGTIISSLFILLFTRPINSLIFHDHRGSQEILLLIISTIFFTYQYATFRATERLFWANLLLLVITGLIPLLVAITAPSHITVFAVLKKLAIFSLSVTLGIIFILQFRFEFWRSCSGYCTRELAYSIKLLIKYGLRRMPIPILLGIIYSGGAIALNYHHAYKESGYFLAALFLLRIIEQAVGPVAVVMLPHLSKEAGQKDFDTIKQYTKNVIEFVFTIGLFVAVQIFLLADYLSNAMYSTSYINTANAFRILSFGIVSVLFFSLSQTIIDAITNRGIVLLASVLGTAISLLGFLILKINSANIAAYLLVISITITSLVLYIYLIFFFNIKPLPQGFGKILFANLIAAVFSYLFIKVLVLLVKLHILSLLINLTFIGIIYLYLCWIFNLNFAKELFQILYPKKWKIQ